MILWAQDSLASWRRAINDGLASIDRSLQEIELDTIRQEDERLELERQLYYLDLLSKG